MTSLHPFDITRMLQNLVRDKFLETHHSGRGAVHCLPGVAIPTPEEVFRVSSAHSTEGSANLVARSAHLPVSSAHSDGSSAQLSKPLTKEGKLKMAFPTVPTQAKQAYCTAELD
jgi:hypothetical protein